MTRGADVITIVMPSAPGPDDGVRTARRLPSLGGMRLAYLDNMKHNADVLLRELDRRLVTAFGAEPGGFYRKTISPALPFGDGVYAEVIQRYDGAIAAIGD